MTAIETPKFVIGRPDEATYQEVTRVLPVDVFLAEYKDSEGKTLTSLCLRPKGTEAVFVLADKIGGTFVASPATRWLKSSLNKKISMDGLDAENPDAVSEEGVEQV